MDKSYILVRGGQRLKGEITIQGAKNTVLPVMASCLLCKGVTILDHCPRIHDVFMMAAAMEQIGCQVTWCGHRLMIDTGNVKECDLSVAYTGNFRASVLLMGALLGREGYVSMGKPGGCRIGSRPINFHLDGFTRLGARVEEKDERYCCYGESLSGSEIHLPFPSVGATENLLLASVMAKGDTKLSGCAREPEIWDLAEHLKEMGAEIEGIGTDCIIVHGGKKLYPADYYVPADRIAAATYLMGAMVTRGDIRALTYGKVDRFESFLTVLEDMGARVVREEGSIRLNMRKKVRPVKLVTGPHPMAPTDIQSMVLAASLTAAGPTDIEENIFESRYQVAEELKKMGGNIVISGKYAKISPVKKLSGAEVNAGDLRGGAALVLAGLMAEGNTIIKSLSYLRRGYENITKDFQRLGAEMIEIIR